MQPVKDFEQSLFNFVYECKKRLLRTYNQLLHCPKITVSN